FGGAIGSGTSQTDLVEVADLASIAGSSAFTTMATKLSVPRYSLASVLVGTKIIVGGGLQTTAAVGNPCFNTVDVFDTATKFTPPLSPAPATPTSGSSAALVGTPAPRGLFAGASVVAYGTPPACETTYPTGELFSATGTRIGSTPLPTNRDNTIAVTLG